MKEDDVKLVGYRTGDRAQTGVIVGDGTEIVPLDAALPPGSAADLTSLIEQWDVLGGKLDLESAERIRLSDVELTAPIPTPRRNVICVGRNYAEHAAEFGRSGYDATGQGADSSHTPSAPVVFTKPPSAVIGSGAEIEPHQDVTSELDYEAELGVIIGRGGRGISREQALDHVWGYTIINDVTARDLQKSHTQWFLGKGLDTFCPMGPWAVTADESGHGPFEVRCTVNGEVRQEASTADLIFDVPTLIATISAGITLQPGDILATGTPKGVGIGFDPPRFLQPGDVVEITISGLGTQTNTVGTDR